MSPSSRPPDAPVCATSPKALFVHILGPGGAGKSTAGALLAQRLGWRFVDLDQFFLAACGNISAFISRHGYSSYAARNVENYAAIARAAGTPAVCALSSGFMTYAEDIDPRYPAMRRAVEAHPLSALLLPSCDIDRCTEIIVGRQLQRPYLPGNRDSEEARIRSRFPLFMGLRCERFLSDAQPEAVAAALASFVRARLEAARRGDASPLSL